MTPYTVRHQLSKILVSLTCHTDRHGESVDSLI
jgi:hypothetical protein